MALLLMGCLQLFAQTRTIKGEVTDAQNGDPLIGATIMVEGEKGGTVTDFDGNFVLQVSSSAKIARRLPMSWSSVMVLRARAT